jgi:hypothetical protein
MLIASSIEPAFLRILLLVAALLGVGLGFIDDSHAPIVAAMFLCGGAA